MAITAPVKASKAFGAGDFFGVNNVQTPTPTSFDTPQDMSPSGHPMTAPITLQRTASDTFVYQVRCDSRPSA